jgi:hypothetical protein
MRTTEIRGACPSCYRRMIAATDVFGEETPMHGDIAICAVCGEANLFDFTKRKNTLRRPTARESLDIDKNTSAIRLRHYQAERGQHELRARSHH